MTHTAYIGIGSNLGAPLRNCRQSIALMGEHPGIEIGQCSSFYKTEPVGREDQNWFVNAVVQTSTVLAPVALLDALLAIESGLGRIRNEKWGPRIIDLDILLYDNRVINSGRLKIPHPEMLRRHFVLAPLAELSPEMLHPVQNKSIHQLLSELPQGKKFIRL